MSKPYQVLSPTAPVPAPDDVLEMIVREGARKMLQSALEKEVDEFLGRGRYERTTEQRGYRNGHLPKRSIGVGMGAVEVSLPPRIGRPTTAGSRRCYWPKGLLPTGRPARRRRLGSRWKTGCCARALVDGEEVAPWTKTSSRLISSARVTSFW